MARNRSKNADPAPRDPEQPIPMGHDQDTPAEQPAASRLPLHAQPMRRKVLATSQQLPTVCSALYAIVSTGARGKIDAIPLHEVPLLRRKIQLQEPAAETPRVLAEFPEHLDRLRPKTLVQLREEYARLVERYSFDKPNSNNGEQVNLVADFYGGGLANLRTAMIRLEQGFRQITGDLGPEDQLSDEQMEELVAVADPDFDLGSGGTGEIPYEPFEPGVKGNGAVVGG